MTQPSQTSCSASNSNRCNHRFANAMRCRLLTPDADSLYCPSHARLVENERKSQDIAASLTADLKEFRSASSINDFLARLLLLLAEEKISPRRAAVLAYITNQLLRTLPAIAKEENAEPTQIIFDMPGPELDRIPDKEPTYADLRT